LATNYKLRALRVGHGWYQKDMCALLGLKAEGSYSQKENGKRPFSQQEIATIAKQFNLDGEQIKAIFFQDSISSNDNLLSYCIQNNENVVSTSQPHIGDLHPLKVAGDEPAS